MPRIEFILAGTLLTIIIALCTYMAVDTYKAEELLFTSIFVLIGAYTTRLSYTIYKLWVDCRD